MRPPETSAGGLRICSTALASVLLPQPDSPASPRVSPGAIESETSSTARTRRSAST